MASLTAHLKQSDDHGRLRFHPECPICRGERLSGALPGEAIVSPRSQALLAASVLALSSATSTAALATEPNQEQEGTTAPEQVVINDVARSPEFDTGGPTTELQFDAGPAPEAEDTVEADATSPPEQEPPIEEILPVADPGDGSDSKSAAQPAEPPTSDPIAAPPEAEPVASEPAPAPSLPETPAATQQEPQVETKAPPRAEERPLRAAAPEHAQPHDPAVTPAQTTPTPQPEPVVVPDVPSGSWTVRLAENTTTHRHATQPADRFHVVQRGESLWSIAKDLLGEDASVARIAREVNRLWDLNSARIGTGAPDLVMAGTRIALR
jgi:hypothetical protein